MPEIDGLIIDNDDLIVQPDGCNQSYVVISAINVKKNISAAPKSYIKNNSTTQTAAKII